MSTGKTHKGVAKRFKVTGSGKLRRRKPGHHHGLRKRTSRQRRGAGEDRAVSPGFENRLKKCLPFA